MSRNLVATLTTEIARIGGLLGGSTLLSMVLLLLGGWLISRLLIASKRVAWRLGVDPGRRLQVVVRWVNLSLFVLIAATVLRRFFVAAPVLMGLLTVGAVAGLMLALARPLQNVVSGAGLILRGRVREGDHIELDGHAGTVRDVSLQRLHVRDAEGQTVLIPNRLLQDRVVTVSRKTHLVPATAQVMLPAPPNRAALETARQTALLSPWRVAGTPVRVWSEDRRLLVELQTWSDAAVHPSRTALEKTLEHLAEGGERAHLDVGGKTSSKPSAKVSSAKVAAPKSALSGKPGRP